MYRILLLPVVILFLVLSTLQASEIKKILIEGNDRIADETILMFANVNQNDEIDNDDDLNNILKKLYETNYFSDVNVSYINSVLKIVVKENPIIQNISIKGVKAKKFKEQILESLILKEKSSYIEELANNDLNLIKSSLKKNGFYFSEIDLTIIKNENNTVSLIYNVDLGNKAKIRKINFIGNKIYKDRKLRKIIVSEEYKPWKFLSSKKYLNEQVLDLDQRLLRNFYLNRGYFNVKISTKFVEYLDNNNFDLTYLVDSGKKIYFKDLILNLPDEYDEKKFEKVNKYLNKLKGEHYSLAAVEKISKLIENISLSNQLEFLTVSINENVIENNQLKFEINISEEERKFYVNRISIFGNSITEETVIRNQLIVDEGDPLNNLLFNKSLNYIEGLNLFASVRGRVVDSNVEGKKDIEIAVVEKATGELSAGAGVGTSGGTIRFGIKERNYLGKGITLDAGLDLNEESIKGNINYYNPNYKNSDKSLLFGISSTNTDRLAEYGYKSSDSGFYLGTQYEQYENIFFRPDLSINYDKIETSVDATDSIKKQEGDYFATKFNYQIEYDKRNRSFQPTSGNRHRFYQSVPLYSKTFALKNTYNFNQYYEITENIVAGMSFYGSMISTMKSGKDVRISERLYIPQKKLRGFESGKIGPKDGEDFVGGNYASAINLNSDLPILAQSQNTDMKIFLDIANLWGADFKSNDGAGSKIRSSTGLAIDWYTPMGPLNFSLAKPITQKSTDKTETFRFNIGTTF